MIIANFLTTALVASVILVPKSGKMEKKEAIQPPPQDLIFEDMPQADAFKDATQPEVVLKKIDKKKKQAKNKRKKNQGVAPASEEESIDENIDAIINKEKELLEVERAKTRTAASSQPQDTFQKIEKKYKSSYATMKLDREITQTLLEKTKSSKGELSLGPKGLLRMEIQEPEKSLLVMDGKNVWVVDYLVDGTRNKVQILRGSISKSLKSQAFLSFFLGQEKILDFFKIEETKLNEDIVSYKLTPNDKKNGDIQKVEIQMDILQEIITQISYWDNIGNKTQLKMFNQKFSESIPSAKFEFKPPNDSEVTNL